jgi:hypothetical protein
MKQCVPSAAHRVTFLKQTLRGPARRRVGFYFEKRRKAILVHPFNSGMKVKAK